MSDRYQGFVHVPDRQAAGQEPRPAQPGPARAVHRGRPARRRHRRRRRHAAGSPSRCPASLDEPRHRRASTTPPTAQTLQGPGLRRHRHHLLRPSWSRCSEFFTPLLRSLDDLPARRRARHPARAGRRARERVAQRALEGFTRASARRSAAAAPSSWCTSPTGAEARGRLDAGVPALPQVGLRLRPGGPDRRAPARPRPREVADWTAPAGRQGRAGHRRQPRHRRADRPGAAPRRRHGRRRRRARRPPSELQAADERARRRPPHPRHHRQGRPAADRPARQGASTAASTSSCTTPASPATRGWPTWTRTAGTR